MPEALQAEAVKVTEIWRDHWPAVRAFALCLGQLRMGPAGPIGLDYTVVLQVFDLLRIRRRRARLAALEQVSVLETELMRSFSRRG
jgi:hypothetical protein